MPTNNEINNEYRAGRLLEGTVYKTSTTWNKPAQMKDTDFIIVEGVGGGGGSQGTPTTGETQGALGGSGAGGGYFFKKIMGSGLSGTETITIGAGGIAGISGGTGAGAGGTTSFGTHASATGGAAGTVCGVAATPSGTRNCPRAVAGNGSGGDINTQGATSNKGLLYFNQSTIRLQDLRGGGSALSSSLSTSGGVVAGTFPGGGAVSTGVAGNTAARVGAVGAAGVLIIAEYY